MTSSLAVPDVQRSPHPSDQIAAYYRDRIQRGELPVGDLLPTIRDLIDEWAVSTHTVQRALKMLRDEDLIEIRRAKRALVIGVPKPPP
jgi:DNA-binding GntR family transcriptional regulator